MEFQSNSKRDHKTPPPDHPDHAATTRPTTVAKVFAHLLEFRLSEGTDCRNPLHSLHVNLRHFRQDKRQGDIMGPYADGHAGHGGSLEGPTTRH